MSKGLNRGMGTILGGVVGCIVAVFAQEIGGGGVGNAVVVGNAVFIFGKTFRILKQTWRRNTIY